MSVLTGAELGGGLPPPAFGNRAAQPNSDIKDTGKAIGFSSDAAILQLTNSTTRAVVQSSQELIDRRKEQNAQEKDQAREAASEEARRRSLEAQGFGDIADPQVVLGEDGDQEAATIEGAAPVSEAEFSAFGQQVAESKPEDEDSEDDSLTAGNSVVRIDVLA